MLDDLFTALEITAFGMGLVFLAIILIWGVISALVRWSEVSEDAPEPVAPPSEALPVQTAIPPKPEKRSTSEMEIADNIPIDPDSAEQERARKVKAAMIAVAVARTRRHALNRSHYRPPQYTSNVHPWQAHLRADQMRQLQRKRSKP